MVPRTFRVRGHRPRRIFSTPSAVLVCAFAAASLYRSATPQHLVAATNLKVKEE
jgi:hypothetical protein